MGEVLTQQRCLDEISNLEARGAVPRTSRLALVSDLKSAKDTDVALK